MEIFVFTFLTLLILAYVSYPLVEAHSKKGIWKKVSSNHRAKELEERKQAIYSAIKDIEFDYQMGKLSEEDFIELRNQYKEEAINLLKQIDRLQSTPKKKKHKSAAKELKYCWKCGSPVSRDDKYCANCGNPLQ
ncbi:MAG: zinc-ribbon domain-containing protein [Calditrichaeota bacterium]|nr:MAG: zinc-ribbon domain-containing protein [Calditrichota bacterium]